MQARYVLNTQHDKRQTTDGRSPVGGGLGWCGRYGRC